MVRAPKNGQEKKGRVPPQNLEAEQSLLGGLLIDPDSINKIVDIVSPDDFYRDAHGRIYEVMLDLYEKNEAIDLITVSSAARDKSLTERIGGVTYLNTLVDFMPSAANIAQYAKMVKEKSLLRRLINVATEIIEKGHEPDTSVDSYIDEAEKMIFQVSEGKFRASFIR
jgi:replicative DNA helicase